VTGIDFRTAPAFEHGNRSPGLSQQVRGGQPDDSAADDEDLDVEVMVEFRCNRHRRRVAPVRQRSGVLEYLLFHGASASKSSAMARGAAEAESASHLAGVARTRDAAYR
jgi:hypothetical protein